MSLSSPQADKWNTENISEKSLRSRVKGPRCSLAAAQIGILEGAFLDTAVRQVCQRSGGRVSTAWFLTIDDVKMTRDAVHNFVQNYFDVLHAWTCVLSPDIKKCQEPPPLIKLALGQLI